MAAMYVQASSSDVRLQPCSCSTSRSCFSRSTPSPNQFWSVRRLETLLHRNDTCQLRERHTARCRIKQTSATSASARPAELSEVAESLPQSREQAVEQALQAIQVQFTAKESRKKKGFKTSSLKKLSVEIPVADQSPAAVVNLALEVANGLPRKLEPCRIIFCNEEAADLCSESGPGRESFFLDDCFDQELDGGLLIVGPTGEQVSKVEKLVSLWRGPGAILLNAEWADDAPAKSKAFLTAFETVYCFLPLAIQGFLSSKEGVVLKWVKQGSPAATPWYIFSKQGDKFIIVGSQQRRPRSEDMELALYNAIAAQSPVTQAVKMFKTLQEKVTKKE